MRIYQTHYRDKDGQRQQSNNWSIDFTDHLQIRRRWPLSISNLRAAQAMGRKLEELVGCRLAKDSPSRELTAWLEMIPVKLRAKMVTAGLISDSQAAGTKPLAVHLDDFRQSLLDSNSTPKHADLKCQRIRRIFDGCGFSFWSDLSASALQRCIADLRAEGISPTTANYYLQAARQFCGWMVRDRRASESPLEHLRPVRINKSEMMKRRALEPDEIRRLLEVLASQGKSYGMEGHQRGILYTLAAQSGLRSSELRALTASSIDFEALTVTVAGAYTKNRQEAVLPLKAETAALLMDHLAGKMPQAPAFDMPNISNVSRMIKKDLLAAGIDPQDSGAGKLDFHSLRHSFGSWLAASGVHPKVAQDLMRHSDINLTMSRYTHTLTGQQARAIAALPDLSSPRQEAQRKTGTDDGNGTSSWENQLPQDTQNDCAKSLAKPCAQERISVDNDGQSGRNVEKDKVAFFSEKPQFPTEKRDSKGLRVLGLEPRTHGLKGRCSAN